jgi:hypothetical protein
LRWLIDKKRLEDRIVGRFIKTQRTGKNRDFGGTMFEVREVFIVFG